MKKSKMIFLIALLFTLVSISAVSAATDFDDTADFQTLETSADEILTTDEHASGEGYIDFDADAVTVEEGKLNEKNITGTLYYSEGAYDWDDVNLNCSYTDGNGIERSYTATIKDSELNFDLSQCEGLSVSDTPYKLTFSPIEDQYYDLFLAYNNDEKLADSYILLTVATPSGPAHNPEIYVSTDGTDAEGYGSQDTPYKTIGYAVSQAEANDIIYINSGTYDVDSITLTQNLTFIGLTNEVIITSSVTTQGKKMFADGTSTENSYKFANLSFTSVKFGSNSMLFELKNTGENIFENCKFNGLALKTVIDSYGATTIANCEFNEDSPNAMSTGSVITLRAKSAIKDTKFTKTTNTLSNGYVKLIYIARSETTLDNVTLSGTSGKFIVFDVAKDTTLNIINSNIVNNEIKAQGTTGGLMFNVGTQKNNFIFVTKTIIANNTIERGLTYGSYAESVFDFNYNLIYNNTGSIVVKNGPSYDLDFNYWGDNANPDGGNIIHWIFVECAHTPDAVFDNEEFTVTAVLKVSDNDGNISDLEDTLPEVPVTFEYNNQKVNKVITDKSCEATFTFDKTAEEILITVINEKITDTITEKELKVYVSPDGTDAEGYGTKNRPYKTIKYAVSQAGPNYTVYIYEGRYDENSITLTDNITIIGENRNVIITSTVNNRKIFESLYNDNGNNISLRFENLTFDTIKPGMYNAILNLRSEGKTEIINCVFENTDGQYNIWSSSPDTSIENCEFKNIGFTSSGNLIYLTGKGTPKIINTTFNKITSTASGVVSLISIINKPTDATIDNLTVSEVSGKFYAININNNGNGNINNSVTIKNSKFENNEFEKTANNQGGALFMAASSSKLEISNSTITDNFAARGIFLGTSAETIINANYNLIYNNTADILNSAVTPSYNMDYNYWGSENPDLGNLNVHIIAIDKELSEMKTIKTPVDPTISVEVNNVHEGENLTIEVTLNEDATGTITITGIEGIAPQNLQNGKTVFIIENLQANQYPITITYGGNYDYNTINYETTIIVKEPKSEIPENLKNVSMNIPEGTTAPEFTINLPSDATGNLTVYVDGTPYTEELVNGSATIKVPDLSVGNHTISTAYTGDDKYFAFETENKTIEIPKAAIPGGDSALNPTTPNGSDSPSYSINLPSDATGNLTVTVDGVNYTQALVNGSATVNVPQLTPGDHNITVTYTGDERYSSITKSSTYKVDEPVIKITDNKNIVMLYSAKTPYKVLVTVNGKAVVGEVVNIEFNGKTHQVKTDANGYATLKLPDAKPKTYTITAEYKGVKVSNKVKVNSIVQAKNTKVKKSKKVNKIKVTLKKVNGKFLKGKTLKLKINKKTLKAKTNKKGVATFKVKKNILKKLKVGKKYKYTVTFGKNTVTKKLIIKK